MAAIEISGLTKDYYVGFWRKRPWRALDNLSLTVERGEVFGFLGHNGAGKTTALKLLTGLIFPTAGTASILGLPIGSPEAFRNVGYLPENPYFYDYLTADELLDYFARFFPLTPEQRRERREIVLEQAGLTEFRHVPLRKYSKGMLQRIGVAQAVLHNPEIVLLDEPMSGLDPVGRRDVRHLILQLKAEGKTVFFSTHILSDAEALCDRVAILHRGKLVGVGQIADLLQRQSGFEAILESCPPDLLPRLQQLAAAPIVASGGQHRLEIAEQNIPQLLSYCASNSVRLLSLNPLRFSLEDYFVELLRTREPASESPAAGSKTARSYRRRSPSPATPSGKPCATACSITWSLLPSS
ncbi:MAG TPA: ABC transporter ATP-binding protein [Terriglobia bacterium]|nr:ABC transporter ATP-binding protein [Terriglobia bacterium]